MKQFLQNSKLLFLLAFIGLCNIGISQTVPSNTISTQAEMSMPDTTFTINPNNVIPVVSNKPTNITATGNNNCTSPTTLTVGGACVTINNTANSYIGPGTGPSCYTGQSANQWFIFQATAANNFVRLAGNVGVCFSGLAIYGPFPTATPGCPTAVNQLFCSKPTLLINDVTTVVFIPGDYYMIQVTDVFGGPCGAAGGSWCLSVLSPTSCSTCAAPCGTMNTYNSVTVPASWSVESPKFAMDPVAKSDVPSVTQCYYFQANNTSISLDMGSSEENLSFGNGFSAFNWTIYGPQPSCALFATGTIANLSPATTVATCNLNYVVCFTFTFHHGQVDSISPYIYAANNSCVLPITLSSFHIEYFSDEENVQIQWSTATEVNNKFFTIEKSLDGVHWEEAINVPSAAENGNSTEPLYYNAVDENPYSGTSYYRLKQTDYDGNSSTFSVIPMNIPFTFSASLFPNPTKGSVTLNYNSTSQDPINVRITDMFGNTLNNLNYNEIQKGANNININTSTLAPGIYFMEIGNSSKTIYRKFVKE